MSGAIQGVLAALGSYVQPRYLSTTETVSNTAGTSHNVSMPATVNAGDLLIMMVTAAITNTATVNDVSGWASPAVTTPAGEDSGASNAQTRCFYKVASGSEGGSTVSVPLSTSGRLVSHVFRIAAGTFNTTVPVILNAHGTTSTTPTMLYETFSAISDEESLWLSYLAWTTASTTVSAYPSGALGTLQSLATVAPAITSCYFASEANSFTPTDYTLSINQPYVNIVIGVMAARPFSPPTAPAAPTLTNSIAATSHNINIPALSTGDRVIVLLGNDNSEVVTPPAGYTAITSTARSGTCRGGAYWRDATGVEGATTVAFTIAASRAMKANVYVVPAGTFDAAQAPEGASLGFVSAQVTEYGGLVPSWGIGDTLWLNLMVHDVGTAPAETPYRDVQNGCYNVANAVTSGNFQVQTSVRAYRGATGRNTQARWTGASGDSVGVQVAVRAA